MNWSRELKSRRQSLGLTQEQMADKLKIGHSTYFKIEQGFSQPGKLLEVYLRLRLGLPEEDASELALT